MKPRFVRLVSSVAAISVLVLAMVAGASCGSPQFSQETQTKMKAALDKLMSDNKIPGGCVGVWSPKGSWTIARGKADIKSGEALAEADAFRIGSTTKTFVSTVVLKLVDQGKLKLDTRIDTYKFPVPVPDGALITVTQLLNHTSGLYDYADDPAFLKTYLDEPLKVWTPEEQLKIAFSHPSYFAPGKGWHYSNTNYILLGLIIEQVTKDTVASQVNLQVLSELGLTKTKYPDSPQMPTPFTHGYVRTEGPQAKVMDMTEQSPSVAGASGAMISTLGDLHRWGVGFGHGTLITVESFDKQRQWVKTGNPDFNYYGLGMMKFGDFIGHGGDIYGYCTCVSYSPQTDTTIVVLLNQDPNYQAKGQAGILLTKQLAKILYPDMKFTGM